MENNDSQNDNSGTSEKRPPATPAKKQTNKNAKKSSGGNKKSANKKRKTLRESWHTATNLKRFEIIIVVLGTATGMGILGNYVWQNLQTKWNFRAEHRPRIIINRPPTLIDPITYSTQSNQFSAHRIRLWYRNTSSNAPAKKAFANIQFKVVPAKPTGDSVTDSPPTITDETCKHVLNIPATFSDVAPNGENVTELAQAAMAYGWLHLKHGDFIRLYAVVCVHYSEESGEEHGTCDSYHLISGETNFLGTDVPISGDFYGDMTGHCAN